MSQQRGVDPLSRAQFWDLIDSIRQRQSNMSVLVATAYMEEAERFDWLVAMNAGEVLATGSAEELRQQTQSATLEEAFINLLPQAQRQGASGGSDPTVSTGKRRDCHRSARSDHAFWFLRCR